MIKSYNRLTMKELRRLAYQLAVENGCRHPFKQEPVMAGEDFGHNVL